MKALQSMVLQADPYSDKLYLLPAWPESWNVRFRLHAPKKTVVEGEYQDGKIVALKVTPRHRRDDIVLIHTDP